MYTYVFVCVRAYNKLYDDVLKMSFKQLFLWVTWVTFAEVDSS